jgi:hypothetical protein
MELGATRKVMPREPEVPDVKPIELPAEPTKPGSLLNKLKRMSLKSPFKPPLASTSASTPSNAVSDPNILALFKSRDPSEATTKNPNDATDDRPASKAASGYTWVIRKWLRKDLEGQDSDPLLQQVSLEWRRQRKRPPTMKRSGSSTSIESRLQSSASHTTSPGLLGLPNVSDDLLSRSNKSLDIARSPPSSPKIEQKDSTEDEGEESDAEDSERPWLCELILPPLPASESQRLRRIKLGTLHPAPHHPRLIGSINIPWSLSAVVLRGTATITAEEQKDFLAVTALWIVVREGLGGIASQSFARS